MNRKNLPAVFLPAVLLILLGGSLITFAMPEKPTDLETSDVNISE
jgi:hypothetical protein